MSTTIVMLASVGWLLTHTYIATLQHVACDRDRDVIM